MGTGLDDDPPRHAPGLGVGRSADDLDVFRLGPLLALGNVELDLLPFLQIAVAVTDDSAEVHEHVLATIDSDETVALVAVEPFHSALRHIDLLAVVRGAPLTTCGGPRLLDRLQSACHGIRGLVIQSTRPGP